MVQKKFCGSGKTHAAHDWADGDIGDRMRRCPGIKPIAVHDAARVGSENYRVAEVKAGQVILYQHRKRRQLTFPVDALEYDRIPGLWRPTKGAAR